MSTSSARHHITEALFKNPETTYFLRQYQDDTRWLFHIETPSQNILPIACMGARHAAAARNCQCTNQCTPLPHRAMWPTVMQGYIHTAYAALLYASSTPVCLRRLLAGLPPSTSWWPGPVRLHCRSRCTSPLPPDGPGPSTHDLGEVPPGGASPRMPPVHPPCSACAG